MNADDLLDRFKDIRSLSDIRGTDQLASIAATLPQDPECYVAIVRDFLQRLNGDFTNLEDDPYWETFDRLSDILRELYVRDFRTFEALICLCDLALNDPGESGLGMNQTATICGRLPPMGRGFANDEEFLQRIETYLESSSMRHNARGIRRKLLQRSPTLVPSPDCYPAT